MVSEQNFLFDKSEHIGIACGALNLEQQKLRKRTYFDCSKEIILLTIRLVSMNFTEK